MIHATPLPPVEGQAVAADRPQFASADHTVSPPRIHIPRDYNAAVDRVERNLAGLRAQYLGA